jgi:hypothetical protein
MVPVSPEAERRMEFQTKIIGKKKNPRARVAIAGVFLLVAAMILALVRGYEHVAMWAFGVAMVVFVGGAIYAKGDLTHTGVSATDLVVNVSEIRMGAVAYPIGQIEELSFLVEGYDGMYVPGTGNRQSSGRSYNGMDNYLSFGCAGEKIECRFYLPDARHVQLLGGVFKEFYAQRVPFLERDTAGWRTFLFAPVTDREWEDMMIENGYR